MVHFYIPHPDYLFTLSLSGLYNYDFAVFFAIKLRLPNATYAYVAPVLELREAGPLVRQRAPLVVAKNWVWRGPSFGPLSES